MAEDSGANAIDVLANDNDGPDVGETLTVTAVTQGTNGSVAITGGGTGVSYTPNANFFGADTFTYTISDGNGGSDTATVTIMVTPVNDAPVAGNDGYSTSQATTLTVPAPGVLGNDADVEGSSLTAVIVTGPTHAFSFNLNADGSFTYTPVASYTGTDTFTYKACEVAGTGNPPETAPVCSAPATVTITIAPGAGVGGGLTTFTQGGWGSKPSGNNPGMLLSTNFVAVFGPSPAGRVTIGNKGTPDYLPLSPHYLKFTSAAAVEDFLPAGGKAAPLTGSQTNPTSSAAGVLAGQVLALQISYDFSNAGKTPFGLAAKCVKSGPLAGKTVQYVLDLANKVIGGNTGLLAANGLSSISQLNDIVTRINENYDGGKADRGYLGSCTP